MIDGGATVGYCATGSFFTATPPSTRMKSAMTQAKIGRSMKKRYMRVLAGGRRGRGGRRLRRRGRRLPGDRLHQRIAAQLLEAVDHHLLARLQAVEHDPFVALRRADLDAARRHLAV